MLSQETINNLKQNGYSFEEIEGIKIGLSEYENGETISKEEMEEFVKKELFAKYMTNV